ncbi:MAG: EmrB/QacA subfamily drug resistance transporter [Candidatus Saccharibacteria bacterium]|nr:EmrB/QacA subfamily drug resistance transporter [Candidatus Saccharibacteria bacterium]
MKTVSKWKVFVLVAIAQFMVVLDSSITNVALPTIKQQLNFTNSSIQWVVTAYVLTFGGFLLLGGRAADLFGRRRTLLIGMGAFTAFSFLIGISQSTTMLIVLRALQGMSAALMSPSALSIVLTTFRDGPDRNKALGYWTLVATGGAALGLLLGGALTQYVGWRWNFFINVPVGIIMAYAIAKNVPKHGREEAYTSLDLPGAVLVTSSLIATVLAFSEASTWGWTSGTTLGVFAAAIVLMTAFVINEKRVQHPLVPMSIFKIRNVSGANLMMAPIYASMLGLFFIVTLYMQGVLHYSPVRTGLAFLPFPMVLGFMSTRTPKLVARYGFKRFLVAGPLLIAVALAWLSRLPVDGNYWVNLLPALLIMPVGMGLTFMPIIAAATSGVPAHEAGLASGLISTSQQMGGALGLAILSGVAASVTASSAHLGALGAVVHGYDRALLVGLAFILVAAALGATVIKQPRRSGAVKSHEQMPRKKVALEL